eukprot:907913-Pelagomonas_calceolata.AAC.1
MQGRSAELAEVATSCGRSAAGAASVAITSQDSQHGNLLEHPPFLLAVCVCTVPEQERSMGSIWSRERPSGSVPLVPSLLLPPHGGRLEAGQMATVVREAIA